MELLKDSSGDHQDGELGDAALKEKNISIGNKVGNWGLTEQVAFVFDRKLFQQLHRFVVVRPYFHITF